MKRNTNMMKIRKETVKFARKVAVKEVKLTGRGKVGRKELKSL